MTLPTLGDLVAKLRRDRFDTTATGPAEPAELDRLARALVDTWLGVGVSIPDSLVRVLRPLAEFVARELAIAYRKGWNDRGESIARELEQARTLAGLRELAEVALEHEGEGV